MVNQSDTKKNVVVIGATGHFGGRICHRLLDQPGCSLVVTSRNIERANELAESLKKQKHQCAINAASLDQTATDFESQLRRLNPLLVVHTAGPYQSQDHNVARACIAINSHYVDLADGRAFTENFSELNNAAKQAGVIAVTGASTLPGLSSSVINHVQHQFHEIQAVKMSIAPGHQTPRGVGTIGAVLSYCGKPFKVLEAGEYHTRFGWHHLTWQHYPMLGKRLSAMCDVPDLSLLKQYVPSLHTITFHAALEAKWEQLSLWLMAWLSRWGIVKNWSKFVKFFNVFSEKLIKLGSDQGGMHMGVSGIDMEGKEKHLDWYLLAKENHGPEIPCTPAIILARKIIRGELSQTGAMPCLGLFTLSEFDQEVKDFRVSWHVVEP